MLYRLAIWAFLLGGIVCLGQQTPTRAYWQTRDAAYNNPVVSGGGGQVLYDAIGTQATAGVPAGTTYAGMTVGAGLTNSALILFATETNNLAISGLSVIWDNGGTNQTMTLIGTQATSGASVWIFGLRNPTAGNKNALLTWSGTPSSLDVIGISFQSVKQTSDAAAFAHFNSTTGASSNPSITITSATGNFTLASYVNSDATPLITAVSGTPIFINNSGNFAAAANRDAGAGSVVMTATENVAPSGWGAAGFDLVAF